MAKKRIHLVSAVNAANVSKSGSTYTIREVCGAVDDLVMNGMLYPADQLAPAAPGLAGKPAPAGHPRNADGTFISATNGEALLSAYIGSVCTNARHEGGRTLVDIVVNEAQAKAADAGTRLLERLDAAIGGTNTEPIHVSTGLMCEVVNAAGESRGKKYSRIATNIRYDHLAILLDEKGAGTPEDGVGMFLNSEGYPEPVEQVSVNAASSKPDVGKAMKSLHDAIDLHEKHMDGTEPTTGAEGEKSQMKMMRMMKAALAALGGGASKGMAMNVASFPEDRRSAGFLAWIGKLIRNSGGYDISFDQITSGLYALMPEGCWIREVFDRYAVWTDRDGRMWKQDYSVSSEGSVAFSGQAVEVTRKVEYHPITTNEESDPMKNLIVAALNAAGIKTEGQSDEQLLAAYNSLTTKPVEEKLTAANSKIAEHEAAARAAEEAEVGALATELAVNSTLTVDDLKKLGKARLVEIKAKAAPVVVGNGAGAKPGDEFASYDMNEHLKPAKA